MTCWPLLFKIFLFWILGYVFQRIIQKKPKQLHTCGGFWTLWHAQTGLLSLENPCQAQTPKQGGRPNIRIRVIQAHLERPMAKFGSRHRRRNRRFPRYRMTSVWWQFIQRRGFQISTNFSRSLTFLLRFYVGIHFL